MNAIYARQSVDKKDSLSIEGQIELCKKYAGEEALAFQDRGFSGKNTKRPAFTELMQAVEEGKIQKIFVYRLDRFSRSISDFSRIWESLERCNVQFNSVTEQFDTSSPIGRAMLNIVLVFAQLERETIAERVKDNYMHRFQLGAWPGGPAPYGYSLTKITDNGRLVSSLEANENADIVRRIFFEYAKPDTSLRSIARELNREGVHGPKREVWDNVTLSRLLHSPLYVRADQDVFYHYLAKGMRIEQEMGAFDGIHACNVIGRRDRSRNKYNELADQTLAVSNHEGIVDSALWLSVQEKLEGQPQIPQNMAGKYSWLTGLLKCEKCGYSVKINYMKKEDKLYLVCSGRSNLSCCNASIRINLRELEQQVGAQIQEFLDASSPEPIGIGAKENADELLAIDQKIDRLITALSESSEISAAYISREIERLHKERERIQTSTAEKRMLPTHLDFDSATFEEKKVIAAEFIDRILMNNNRANIVWRI
jgi:DNA invertase Pin-like site-specific DNA recombinase